eukprot:Pgem_evm1s19680
MEDWLGIRKVTSFYYFTDCNETYKESSRIRNVQLNNNNFSFPPNVLSRLPKLVPQRFLPDYDVWIYVDDNIVKPNLKLAGKYLKYFIRKNADHLVRKHPRRTSVFAEMNLILDRGLCQPHQVKALRKTLLNEKLPNSLGLSYNNFIIRRNNYNVRLVNEMWWDNFLKFECKRDQLTYEYSVWKAKKRQEKEEKTNERKNEVYMWWDNFLKFECKRDQLTYEYIVCKAKVNYHQIRPQGYYNDCIFHKDSCLYNETILHHRTDINFTLL